MSSRSAWNLTRQDMHYRHDSFSAGLKAAGFEVRTDRPIGKPGACLLIWNRYGHYHDVATSFEQAGGTVVVVENGYIGRDRNGNQRYAIALHGHNGSGQWYAGGPERWSALGLSCAPWRASGDKIVIRGQRGIGSPGMASPPRWMESTYATLKAATKRQIQCVPHPGNGAEKDLSHEQYLLGAHALVIWSSSVGVKALAMGVPVFYCAPHWICEGAAKPGIKSLESPMLDDVARLAAMQRMAWAQWTLDEIQSGEPFVRLLERERVAA